MKCNVVSNKHWRENYIYFKWEKDQDGRFNPGECPTHPSIPFLGEGGDLEGPIWLQKLGVNKPGVEVSWGYIAQCFVLTFLQKSKRNFQVWFLSLHIHKDHGRCQASTQDFWLERCFGQRIEKGIETAICFWPKSPNPDFQKPIENANHLWKLTSRWLDSPGGGSNFCKQRPAPEINPYQTPTLWLQITPKTPWWACAAAKWAILREPHPLKIWVSQRSATNYPTTFSDFAQQ